MTRRSWALTILPTFCAACLAGCARTAVRDPESLPLFQVPPARAISTDNAPPATPYPVMTTPKATEPASGADAPKAAVPAAAPAACCPPAQPAEGSVRPAAVTPADAGGSMPVPIVRTSQVETPVPPPPPPPEDKPLVKALRCLMDNRPAEAVSLLNGYGEPNQDLLLSLLSLSARVSEQGAARTSPREYTTTIEHLEGTQAALRTRAELVLDKICFCKWIDKFGVFEALPPGHVFLPGCLVQVYVELRNFASEQRDQFYETHLASTVKLLGADGKVAFVWGFNDRCRPERSQTLRHDYFINYHLRIPECLPAGEYKLVLHIEDLPTKRTVERSLKLTVSARPPAAN